MNGKTLTLDLTRVAFSRRETNWAVSTPRYDKPSRIDRLYLRYIYGGEATEVYRIDLLDREGTELDYLAQVCAEPHRISIPAGDGELEIILPEPHVCRMRGRGVRLRLTLAETRDQGWAWDEIMPAGDSRYRAIVGPVKHHIIPITGEVEVKAPWGPRGTGSHRHHNCRPYVFELNDNFDVVFEDYPSEWEPRDHSGIFDEETARVKKEFDRWHDDGPVGPDKYRRTSLLSSYVTWSAVVPPSGNFKDPAMLMSKRWMLNAWNWDNYYNAWATSLRDRELAWQLFGLHMGHQNPQGALADGINEVSIGWTYTKPPVHGWMLRRMYEGGTVSLDQVSSVYGNLVRWTEWWFTYRDDDKDGICQYHHGNDSGWDDASAFDVTPPVESPDLTALLIVQMDSLAFFADLMGRSQEAADWKRRAGETLDGLIKHSWRDGRFVPFQSGTHEAVSDGGDSLLCRIPIILGHRLPEEIRRALVADLSEKGRFLTDHGLATEALTSPHFLRKGYWRGPMWAPAVMMIVDGLIDGGEKELGRKIARIFCDTCETSGFAECFDPMDGAPLHDPAYTWTASIFTLLSQVLMD